LDQLFLHVFTHVSVSGRSVLLFNKIEDDDTFQLFLCIFAR